MIYICGIVNVTTMDKLVGRTYEKRELQRAFDSDRSEFIILFGRRRVGKTYLVKNFFENDFVFHFVGSHGLSQDKQLSKFASSLQQYAPNETVKEPKDWFEAFGMLEKYLATVDKKRKVVFIDEMPWIDTHNSDFVSALESFWNGWASMRDDIVFIACGSATSWMVDMLVNNQGGLHNRITMSLYLRPFNLSECEEYLQNKDCEWDRKQIVEAYMILGGVPMYYSLLDTTMSLAQNVDRLFFRKNGLLKNEYEELYNALFRSADKYQQIVRVLSSKREGMTRSEIESATGMSGGSLTKILTNLERCDFTTSYAKFGNKKKEKTIRLIDFFTLFYFKFMENDDTNDEAFWTHHINSPKINSWQGLSFEMVCMAHTFAIKKKLGISGMATGVYTWRNSGKETENKAQIDLLIDRADRIINLCEMKFSEEPYVISKEYADKLRMRQAIFKNESNTRKGICNTFVTTYGIVRGKNSGIVDNEVVMEDLFVRE